MEKWKINPWVAWMFLLTIAAIVGGLLNNIPVMMFCGTAMFLGGIGWLIRNDY